MSGADTNRWRRAGQAWHGWWGNKAPPHRTLIKVGAILSVVLIAAGLACDASEDVRSSLPDLPSLLLDLAKGTSLGTLSISVLSDVQTWAASWRVLQGQEPRIGTTGHELLSLVADNLGLKGNFPEGLRTLDTLADRGRSIAGWVSVVADACYERSRAILLRLPERPEPLASWNSLEAVLQSEGEWTPDRTQLQDLDDLEERVAQVERVVEDLCVALEEIRGSTSTGVNSRAGHELVGLRRVPDLIRLLRTSLVHLSAERVPQSDGGEWSHLLASVIGFAGLVELILFETRRGRPHAFRASG